MIYMKSLNSYINEKFQVPKDYKNPYDDFDEYGEGEIVKSNNVMHDLFKSYFNVSLSANTIHNLNKYLIDIDIPIDRDVVLYRISDKHFLDNKSLFNLLKSEKSVAKGNFTHDIRSYFYKFVEKDISMIIMEKEGDTPTIELFLYIIK